MGSKPRLMGYRRPNGTIGIRNHVIILPLDDLSNAAAEAVQKLFLEHLRCHMHLADCNLDKI